MGVAATGGPSLGVADEEDEDDTEDYRGEAEEETEDEGDPEDREDDATPTRRRAVRAALRRTRAVTTTPKRAAG